MSRRNGKVLEIKTAQRGRDQPRRIALVAFADVQVLDVTGPLEVFARTARWLIEHGRRNSPAYTTELLAAEAGGELGALCAELLLELSHPEA